MSKLDDAAFVAPPISGSGDQAVLATQTVDGVLCLATTAASQLVKIPEKWRGRYLNFQAIGLDIDVLVGTASVSVTVNQVSTLNGSGNPTLNAATGGTVFASQERQWATERADGQTHFAFRSTGTSGFIKVWPSDKRHVGKNGG
jgi:hypothetical protein